MSRKKLLIAFWMLVFTPFLFIGAMLVWANYSDLPSFSELENPKNSLASQVYTTDKIVIGKFYSKNRVSTSYNELSPYLEQALVSTEDERFYEHAGVDFRAVLRAIIGQFDVRKNYGGGSTITQQLAKMMFHDIGAKTKYQRGAQKFKEWIIGVRLEKQYTKQEIITMYLNKFDYLYGAVGIKTAAEIYFDKLPKDLLIEEAAMLVGMAKNPYFYNPKIKPENALKRRNQVLFQMLRNDAISRTEFDSLEVLPIQLKFKESKRKRWMAPHFRQVLRKEVDKLLSDKKNFNPYNEKYNIYRDGLKIYTTLDSRMQKHAEEAVASHLTNLQQTFNKNNKSKRNAPFANSFSKKQVASIMKRSMKRSDRYRSMKKGWKDEKGVLHEYSEKEIEAAFNKPIKMKVFDWASKGREKEMMMSPNDSIRHYKNLLRCGMMSVDPKTGFIKAWVGGANYKHFKFDAVFQTKRQVGSTIKPFVYATAIRDNIVTPCDKYANTKKCIDVPYGSQIRQWCPDNAGTPFDGVATPVYYALAVSWNNITAQIIKKTEMSNVIKLLTQMGISKKQLPDVPALGLGVCDMSVYQMTAAQAILANNGIYNKPIMITRIEDKFGNTIYDVIPNSKEVLDARTANTVLTMMKGAVDGVSRVPGEKVKGTARRLRFNRPYGNITYPIAAKTGTTQNASDGWFMGLTPDLVTGVWVGNEDYAVRFQNWALGTGTNMALPIWGYYMKSVWKDKKIKISKGDFEIPEGVSIPSLQCDETNVFDQNVFE